MAEKRMLWQLYPSYILVIILTVISVAWYASSELRSFHLDQMSDNLRARAQFVEAQISGMIEPDNSAVIDSLCDLLGNVTGTRVTVVMKSGLVIGDSENNPALMENHGDRPEIIDALNGDIGQSVRYSTTITETLMYVAIPIRVGGEITSVVRTSMPITHVELELTDIQRKIAVAGVIVAILAAVVSLFVSRRITRPIEHLRKAADLFARGHLRRKLIVTGSEELSSLAAAMNSMAKELDDRINTITRQRNEQEAIFASMSEGVIAVDDEEYIIGMNRAAADLIGIGLDKARGRVVQEVIRNAKLQKMVSKTLEAGEASESAIIVRDGEERYIQSSGALLRDSRGDSIGAVIVLNDMTRLKRLENVRTEFVANVSHELKTPVTSIKGYVETLLDGSLEDANEARRFLQVVARHADRLDSIIEDLLSLSRIEQEAEQSVVEVEVTKIEEILNSAIQACAARAEAKQIGVELDCDGSMTATVNPLLLEQAVVNLIDNSIKYSDNGSIVYVSAVEGDLSIDVSVRDKGKGIAREHLARVFERFYRVDKSRSRELGGTGLGLAIVKHIAIAHGGRVAIESEPGVGTTCTIHLPKQQ